MQWDESREANQLKSPMSWCLRRQVPKIKPSLFPQPRLPPHNAHPYTTSPPLEDEKGLEDRWMAATVIDRFGGMHISGDVAGDGNDWQLS